MTATTSKTTKSNASKNGKAESNGHSTPRRRKEGLRDPQVRILACLAKSSSPLSRGQIAEKAPVDLAFCTSYIGANDPEVRERLAEQRGYKSLIGLGYVKVEKREEGTVHSITASGRKALEKAKAEK